jgi:putative spermidine/putrescine transport system permease protein
MAVASVFLLAPLVIIALSSLSPTPVFDLPVGGASLRWYAAVGSLDGFWPACRFHLRSRFSRQRSRS